MHHFVDVAHMLSCFCKMTRRSKAVGPRWTIHLASFLAMPRQWCDLREFNQTHNASMFSSKCKTFGLQVRIT